MQNYTNWLKNCIDGIRNVNLGDISGYGQALYWQFMFLGTIILTLIAIAAVFSILCVGPFLYIKKQKQCFITDVEHIKQKLCGVKKVNFNGESFNGERSFIVQIDLFSDKEKAIAKKYVKRCSRIATIILAMLTFLIFPLFMDFLEEITILSLIGGVAFIAIAIFVIADFLWFIISLGTENIFSGIIFDSIFDRIVITLKDNVPGHMLDCFILDGFIVKVFNVSNNFKESIMCKAMDNCKSKLELNDESFENNIDNFYTWMNKFVMREYVILEILGILD